MLIDILALDGVFDTGLAALQDTLAIAAELGSGQPGLSAPLLTRVVGVRRGVMTANGLKVPTQMASGLSRPDVIVVPALGAKTPQTLGCALGHPDVARAGALLRERRSEGVLAAAACTGVFVLAETGLLDGRTATASWWLGPFFRARYPRVDLDDGRMVVRSNDVVTAGAALAHFDLALWLVREISPALAAVTARYLMIDPRSSQAAYAIPDHLAHADAVVERFERWARENLLNGFSLDDASRAIGASPRTLARRLRAVLGKSPLSYFQDLRVERAVHLLQTTGESVGKIAGEVGYSDAVTLRNLLRRRLGRSASQLRRLDG
ncbi:MAG TPA: helix-turn-helix domain-containing protein [Caulobacteraceae bacterium]|jgi:transcriptional regulator GlxA family with amidase domain|nr:helix-turn-helix domain-containing protein [Caulobacteraceae bacterium]